MEPTLSKIDPRIDHCKKARIIDLAHQKNGFESPGCLRSLKNGDEDEICQAQNEIKRLYYDQKHQIFIFLEPKYAIENHHVCHIKVLGESAEINCGVGNLITKRSHSIIIGNENTRRKGRRKTFYHMENSSYHPHSQRRTNNV